MFNFLYDACRHIKDTKINKLHKCKILLSVFVKKDTLLSSLGGQNLSMTSAAPCEFGKAYCKILYKLLK